MGHNYGGIVSPRADVVTLDMVDSFDKRHLEWLVSDEEIRLNEFVESSFGKEFADADQALKETIAQRLNYARRFDYGLYADADLSNSAIDELAKVIGIHLGRKLATRSKSQLNCLIANLYRVYNINENLKLSVAMRNGKTVPKRYNPSGVANKTLKSLVTALTTLGFTYHVPGKFDRTYGRKSVLPRIAASESLIKFLEKQHGWKPTIIKFHSSDALVILNSIKGSDGTRNRLNFADTSETLAMSDFIRCYNEYMSNQEIILFDGWKRFPDMIRMRRTFTDGSWERGGRLFGGEYQQLSKQHREQITINGSSTAEVDLKSCHPTMAFAAVGIDWYSKHNRDIYDLSDDHWPRDIIKKAFNIMLNAKSRAKAVGALNDLSPEEFSTDEGYFVKYKGWAKHIVQSIEVAYPELSNIFYADYGNTFMKAEGDICSQVMKQCMNLDIPVLTLHDSFICPEQHKETVSKLVYEAFVDVVGVSCVVK